MKRSPFFVSWRSKDNQYTGFMSRLLLTKWLDADLDIAWPFAAVNEVSRGRLLSLCHATDIFPGVFGLEVLQFEQMHVGVLFTHRHVSGCLSGGIIGAQDWHGTGAHHGHRRAAEDPRHREKTLWHILSLDGAAKLQRLTGREGPSIRAHLDAEVSIWARETKLAKRSHNEWSKSKTYHGFVS